MRLTIGLWPTSDAEHRRMIDCPCLAWFPMDPLGHLLADALGYETGSPQQQEGRNAYGIEMPSRVRVLMSMRPV